MKIEIKNRWNFSALFTAEIACDEITSYGLKLGMAVKKAIKAKANLSGANLSGANLSGANLLGANLSGANLSGANLSGANLLGADLLGADLLGADLSVADLSGADLSGADLSGADLSVADLSGADLSGADLSVANLSGANLLGADLSGAKNAKIAIASTRIIPDGDIIGWKKCRDGVIVKLLIPSDAKRSNATGRKCRAEFAKVLEIFGADEARSQHDYDFIYKVGKTVKPSDPFSEDWNNECAPGIHFFITRVEAENY